MPQHGLQITRRALIAAALSTPAVEAWAGARSETKTTLAKGTRFETPAHLIDSGCKGPTVAIIAGIHGNETAPPRAAKKLLSEPIDRGRLWILPQANRPALAAKSRHTPKAKHPDLNRNFPTTKRNARGVMAPHLWKALVDLAPDFVLDLHEGWGFRASSTSMGSSVVVAKAAATEKKSLKLANVVLAEINKTVEKKTRKFKLIQPGPKGSLGRSVAHKLTTPSVVFETTWTQKMDLRVTQQLLMVRTALRELHVLCD